VGTSGEYLLDLYWGSSRKVISLPKNDKRFQCHFERAPSHPYKGFLRYDSDHPRKVLSFQRAIEISEKTLLEDSKGREEGLELELAR